MTEEKQPRERGFWKDGGLGGFLSLVAVAVLAGYGGLMVERNQQRNIANEELEKAHKEISHLEGKLEYTPRIQVGDFDYDGFPDIRIRSASKRNHVFLNNGKGKYELASDYWLSSRRDSNLALLEKRFAEFSDTNHDGIVSFAEQVSAWNKAGYNGPFFETGGQEQFPDIPYHKQLELLGSEVYK